MDTFELLVESLNHDYNPDYWSDHIKLRIGEQLDELGDEDWSRLETTWRNQSVGWRIRLAEASFLSENPRAINLLIEMLKSPEPEVGCVVAETLLEKNYQWSPEVSLLSDLERHLNRAALQDQVPIKRLISRLPA